MQMFKVPFHIRRDNLALAVADMVPEWLIYWCVVRAFTHATTGPYRNEDVTEVKALDVLKRWANRNKPKQPLPEDQIEMPLGDAPGFVRR